MRDRISTSLQTLVSTESLLRFCGRRGEGVLIWDRCHELLGANDRASKLLKLPSAVLSSGRSIDEVRSAVARGPLGVSGADLFPADLAAIDWAAPENLPPEIRYEACGVAISFAAVSSEVVVANLFPAGTISSAVEALARQNLYLETTLENLTDGVMMVDEDNCIIACNRRYRELICVAEEDYFLGMTLFEFGMLHGDLLDLPHEERVRIAKKRAGWAGASGGASVRKSMRRTNAAGRVIGITRTRLSKGGVVVTVRDETNEHQLRRQRALLETVINNIDDGVSLMSRGGYYEVYNERFLELFGVDPAQIQVGTHILDLFRCSSDYAAMPVHQAEAEMHRRVEMALSQSDEFLEYERELLSGHTINLRRVLLDDDAIVTMYRDVTQEKERAALVEQARQDAEEANRLKSDFIARVTHELRTPMHGVLGMAELIRQSPLSDNQERCLDVLCRSGRHMVDLIDGLLTISTIETGDLALEPEKTDLVRLIGDCVDMIRPRAEEKNLALSVDHDFSAGAVVMVDGLRLAQILINLITNAVKYTDTGRIDVCAHTVDDETDVVLHVDIMDSGCGIAPEQLSAIFDKFKQIRTGDGAMVEGVGLGLSIAQSLATAMGGRLEATSVLGQGSTFSIVIRASVVGGIASLPRAASTAASGPD